MSSLSAIRDAIKTAVDTITGLHAYDTIPDTITVPCAVVGGPERIQFDATMQRGLDRHTIILRVYASRASDRAGQDRLDALLAKTGSGSVKTAIESDPTLGGVVATCRVIEARGYGAYIVAGIDYIGVEFVLDVVA